MYDATGTQGTNAQMLYTCPHCQGRFEFNTESLVRQIFCPLCGQGFDPVKLETMRYPEGTPVAPSPGAAPETIQVANKDEKLRIGARLGQFRIDEFIGRGGMGAVYRATQTSLDRAVALKVLPRHMAEDPEFVQRFHREAKALAELNHPNIVSIYDKGNEGGQYFFAMELVDGVSLRQLIKSKKASPQEALKLVPQLCEALEYAHARGVIHRDIKPENILVDRYGRVKIADFGLARIIRGDNATSFDGLTRSDVMMGTVNYMAPEQRENAKDVDHRADIYSLGVVIYELLTGELPIGRFAPPSKKVQIDVRFDEVVLQLLEKDREDRYQNVTDVKTVFARVMTEPPQQVPAPVAPQEPLPWWARSLPGGFLGLLGTVFFAVGVQMLTDPQVQPAGLIGLLAGGAFLAWSFWIDHGRPAPGAKVRSMETAGGFIMLGLGLLAIGGTLIEATVAREGFMRFWSGVGGWLDLIVSMLVFIGLEGLSSHIKVRSERGRWVGTVANVTNLAMVLLGFVLVRITPTRPEELAFQLMLGYPIAAGVVFGLGWWVAGARKAAVVAVPRPAGRGGVAFAVVGFLLLLTASVLATVQLVEQVVHPWPFAWGTGEVEVSDWGTMISVKDLPTRHWLDRHQMAYGVLAAACLGLISLSMRLGTRTGKGLVWTGMIVAVATSAAGAAFIGLSGADARDWIARLASALAVPVSLATFGVLWLASRRADRSLYGVEKEIEAPVDRWAMRVFQAGCVLWIVGAILTSKVGYGLTPSAVGGVLALLGAPVVLLGLTAVRRIGGSEDGRGGLHYAIAGVVGAAVFPAMLLSDSAGALGPFTIARYMEVHFFSAWLFVGFALLDAVLRPSQRLGRYFGLGGSLERGAWIGAILGTAAIGGLLIAFDFRDVNRGNNVLLASVPFVGTLAYVFLVAWGVPLPALGKECESECPILDKGVSIEANCPSGAGVSIHLGTSAPPVPSTPATSSPPPPPAAGTVQGVPSADEIQAQVRAAIAEIPSAEEIKAQVREGLAAAGIGVSAAPQAVPAVTEKALRKGQKKTRAMWQEWLWHAGAFVIINGVFVGMGKWNTFSVMWGAIVAAHGLNVLFRTLVDPPHRPAANPASQKRRKSLYGFLQHATWYAAVMTWMSYPHWDFPTWGWFWGIGVAFHLLSTILDFAFGKDA